MTNKKQRRRDSRSDASRNQSTSPASAPRSSWRVIVVVAVIAVPLVALLVYLKWIGKNLAQQADTPLISEISRELPSPAQPGPANSAATWNRPVKSTGGSWETDNNQAEIWKEIDSPSKDGWDTEVFANAATDQFNKLKKLLAHPDALSDESIGFMTQAEVQLDQLRPAKLEKRFQDASLTIERMVPRGEIDVAELPVDSKGQSGLVQTLRDLMSLFTDPEAVRMKIKVFRVQKLKAGVETWQTLEMFGPSAKGLVEVNSIWRARWDGDFDHPRLTYLGVSEYEQAEKTGKTLFAECTESVLAKNPSFREQLLKGYNFWLERGQFQRFFNLLSTPGIAIGDVNADGLEDLYLCQEEGIPNLLFLQQPDGTLRDVSHESGADWLQSSRIALIVDLDNDGNQDLAVGVAGGVVLARGDGQGHFKIATVLDSDDDVMALAAADYDLDGRLDLYVGCDYPNDIGDESQEVAVGGGDDFVYYDASNGGLNSLFHNEIADGQWKFSDVTQSVGMDSNNGRFTFAASWEDYDNDGDPDLYVANDFGPNNLFRNDLGADGKRVFVNVAQEADAEDSAAGMSVAWGDYDHDGWMDLYVSNMFSYAGNRIMFQDQFQTKASDQVKKRFQRFARGNTLMKNLGKSNPNDVLKFQDRTLEAAVNRGRWAWGSGFVDVNNDGWDDLVVANGYITTDDTGDL